MAAAVATITVAIVAMTPVIMPVPVFMTILGAMRRVIRFANDYRRVVGRHHDGMAIASALVEQVEAVVCAPADGDGNTGLGDNDAARGGVTIFVISVTVTGGECGKRGEQECSSNE
jgi:hypothetical protein